jgi:hypothetical protein
LFDRETWLMLKANSTAAQVIALVDGERPVAQIAADVASYHGISQPLVLLDIRRFAYQLVGLGIAVEVHSETA